MIKHFPFVSTGAAASGFRSEDLGSFHLFSPKTPNRKRRAIYTCREGWGQVSKGETHPRETYSAQDLN